MSIRFLVCVVVVGCLTMEPFFPIWFFYDVPKNVAVSLRHCQERKEKPIVSIESICIPFFSKGTALVWPSSTWPANLQTHTQRRRTDRKPDHIYFVYQYGLLPLFQVAPSTIRVQLYSGQRFGGSSFSGAGACLILITCCHFLGIFYIYCKS